MKVVNLLKKVAEIRTKIIKNSVQKSMKILVIVMEDTKQNVKIMILQIFVLFEMLK